MYLFDHTLIRETYVENQLDPITIMNIRNEMTRFVLEKSLINNQQARKLTAELQAEAQLVFEELLQNWLHHWSPVIRLAQEGAMSYLQSKNIAFEKRNHASYVGLIELKINDENVKAVRSSWHTPMPHHQHCRMLDLSYHTDLLVNETIATHFFTSDLQRMDAKLAAYRQCMDDIQAEHHTYANHLLEIQTITDAILATEGLDWKTRFDFLI